MDEAVTAYLNDIGRKKQLSHAQVIELAKRIEAGDKQAKTELVEANLLLVVTIAKRHQGNGLDLPDLIQEGNLGLIRAAKKFNWRLGYRFSTYATCWIRQAITKAIADTGRAIRIPANLVEILRRLAKFIHHWHRLHDEEPSQEVIVAELKLTPGTVQHAFEAMIDIISLESRSADCDEPDELIDLIANEEAIDPTETIIQDELRCAALEVLDQLLPREREVIIKHLGFDGEPMTLKEIGESLSTPRTRERMRQVEKTGMQKLRRSRSKRIRRLRELVND